MGPRLINSLCFPSRWPVFTAKPKLRILSVTVTGQRWMSWGALLLIPPWPWKSDHLTLASCSQSTLQALCWALREEGRSRVGVHRLVGETNKGRTVWGMGQGSSQDPGGELRDCFPEIKLRLTLEGWIRVYQVNRKEKVIPSAIITISPGPSTSAPSPNTWVTLSCSRFYAQSLLRPFPALEALHPYPLAQVLLTLRSTGEIHFSLASLSQSGGGGNPKGGFLLLRVTSHKT